jgi:hypothetical protein
MFVAIMLLHILLCDEVFLYFILRIGIIQKLKLEFESKVFKFLKLFSIFLWPWVRILAEAQPASAFPLSCMSHSAQPVGVVG